MHGILCFLRDIIVYHERFLLLWLFEASAKCCHLRSQTGLNNSQVSCCVQRSIYTCTVVMHVMQLAECLCTPDSQTAVCGHTHEVAANSVQSGNCKCTAIRRVCWLLCCQGCSDVTKQLIHRLLFGQSIKTHNPQPPGFCA